MDTPSLCGNFEKLSREQGDVAESGIPTGKGIDGTVDHRKHPYLPQAGIGRGLLKPMFYYDAPCLLSEQVSEP